MRRAALLWGVFVLPGNGALFHAEVNILHVLSIKFQVAPKVLRSLSAVHTAHRPGIVGRILCMVAQVGEPGAIAVASR